IPVPAGDRLVVELTNTDDDVHDLVLADGSTTGRVAPGETVTLDVGVVVGDLDGWCSVAGHRLMGMTLTVDVGDVGDVGDGGDVGDVGDGGDGGDGGTSAAGAPSAGAHAGHGTTGERSLGASDADLM